MKTQTCTVVDEITNYVAGEHDIRLAILFGSLANGQHRRDSDLDIAVLADRPLSAERRIDLIENLARVSGRAVDLVDLATAGIAVARSAVLGGRLLFCRDDAVYPAQITRVLLDCADFLPYRDRLLRERREQWIQ
ncbi:MAG: nucleotidyltransferase domain-containing protein [Salinisphaera sp.]|nr:nucleotidyltransferase domain-containing protein [Salinisphaera sp.]